MICVSQKCAREIPEDAIFCPYCGKKQTADPKPHRRRANGTGTIYRKKGNRSKPWIVEKNHITIGEYKSFSEATKALERLTDDDITDKYNLTFSQIYDRWKPVHYREVSKSQQNNYTSAYGHCRALYSRKFRTLRKSDFQEVIIEMEELDYSKSSCEKVLQLFGQLSQWAMDETIIRQNYSANVKTVAAQKSSRTPYTAQELALIKASTAPAAAILRILIATGCRGKDLFTARLSDCHGDYFISGSKSEAGYDRAISVSDYGLTDYQSLSLMASITAGSKSGPLLIDGYTRNRDYSNWVRRDYAELCADLGIDSKSKTPYSARHTYITAAYKSGIPREVLRRQVGHESDSEITDKIYNHADDAYIVSTCRKVHIE